MAGFGTFGGSGSSSGFGGFSGSAPAGGSHGVLGLVSNLGNDVKGAVEGFIPGVIHFAEHPVGSAEQMAKATWSTWSPLFHGQFTKFGQGIYEHPLAPLLDMATIFSLGLGTAARIGAASDALTAGIAADAEAGLMASRGTQVFRALTSKTYHAPGGQLARDAEILQKGMDPLGTAPQLDKASNMFHAAARLRIPSAKILRDTTDANRAPLVKQFSQVPSRHLFQQTLGKGFEKLPPNIQGYLGRKVYEKALYGEMARRAVYAVASKAGVMAASERLAKMEADAAAHAGHMPTLNHLTTAHRMLEDPTAGPQIRAQLAFGFPVNLDRHAPYVASSPEHAASVIVAHSGHIGAIMKPVSDTESLLGRTHRQIEHFTQLAQKHAAVRPVEHVQAELDHQNALLKDMHDNGYLHTQTPALNSKGEPAVSPTVRQSMEQHAQPILEVQRNVKRLERELNRSRKSEAIRATAHQRLDDLYQRKIDLEQRGANYVFEKHGMTHESLVHFANNAGRILTKSFKGWDEAKIAGEIRRRGWMRADGSVPLVPMHDAEMMGKEMAGGLAFIRSLGKATRWWKTLQVKLSPKTVVNNTLANHVIAMFRHSDPLTAFRALYHAYRLSHGKDFADQILHDAMLRGGDKSWLMRAAGAELHNTFLQGAYEDTSPEGLVKMRAAEDASKKASRFSRAIRGPMMYGPVSKIADQPVRLGAIYTYVTKEPAVIHLADRLQRLAAREGRTLSRTHALDQAAGRVLKENPTLRDRAANFGRTIAGDYLAQTPKEQALKDFVPFYLWDRHIAKSGANIVLDTPLRAAIAQQVSQQGIAEAQKFLGNLPDFMQGAVPLQMLGLSGTSSDGRMNAIVGPSLNPFGTLGEFAGAAESLIGNGDISKASDLLGQINPLLTDSISAASGKDIVTGSSLKGPGGLIPNVLYNLGTGLPQEKIIQAAVEGPITQTTTGSGKTFPKLYSQNELAAISNFLGIPIKQISPSTAQYLAKSQQPKRKHSPFGGL
jgi:hypothetical protein